MSAPSTLMIGWNISRASGGMTLAACSLEPTLPDLPTYPNFRLLREYLHAIIRTKSESKYATDAAARRSSQSLLNASCVPLSPWWLGTQHR
jgi:hypothetical protein